MFSTSSAMSEHGNVEPSHGHQPSPSFMPDIQPDMRISSTPAPFIPDVPPQYDAEFPNDDVQLPEPSDPPIASNVPGSSSGEIIGMDFSPEVPSAQLPHDTAEGSSSAVAEEGRLSISSSIAEGYDTESKPMISDEGILLINNGIPPQDAEMAEGGADEEDEEDEDYSDLTDDESSDGPAKLSALACCSEVFYDDDSEERHCQMCE